MNDTFKLTGEPISWECKNIVARLFQGYDVSMEEILEIPEIKDGYDIIP